VQKFSDERLWFPKVEIPLMIDDRRRHQRIEIALEGFASFDENEPVSVLFCGTLYDDSS